MTKARQSEIFREVRPSAAPGLITRGPQAAPYPGPAGPAQPALDLALDRALSAGRAAWPGVSVDADDYTRYLAARVDEGEDPLAAIEALHTTDLYLACACSSGSEEAVGVFARRLLADLGGALAPAGATALAEDVRQILLERLFVRGEGSLPKIATYSGRGPLGAWVRVSAVRIAVSLRRGEHAAEAPDHAGAPEPLAEGVDPELDALKLHYAAAFNAALREAFSHLVPRDRTLLKLHYVDGVSVERIAGSYNVHRVSASRWLSAARARVLEETTRLLRERQRLTESELESVTRLVRSRLEVSLRSAIGDAGHAGGPGAG
jgi:RNA polymerase sigma-70 factor (ECF subfamily)